MGTPEFAVASLQILHENDCEIVGVITAPDKPKGRGKKVQSSPVKEYAERVGLNILQPTNLKSEVFLSELKALQADLQIVVAFRMLPEVVWDMPKKGTFNLHGSLLPQYRGAAPINWAIINGEKETGVTTFFLKHEIDTGSVILQDSEPIHNDDNVGDVYARLMEKGARLVLKTVQQVANDTYELKPQKEDQPLKSAPKIHKSTCEIDWTQSSEVIRNFIRGLSPYPAAWTHWGDKNFKIYCAELSAERKKTDHSPGTYQTDGKTFFSVKTGDGWLDIITLQMEGKKRMNIEDLLRGFTFEL
jgi:methionyl-tRNA formyltransferase